MVLESIISANSVRRHPLFMLFLAVLMSTAGIWVSWQFYPAYSSLLSIAFITIALTPIMHSFLEYEETIEAKKPGFFMSFIARHFNLLQAYAWFFLGLIISYAFWYAVLPIDVRDNVFAEQERTFEQIGKLKEGLSGMASGTGYTACGNNAACWFETIFANNAKVMVLAIVFSFVFGAGAIFLIGWNASIIGTVIGKDIIALGASYAHYGLFNGVLAFFHGLFNAIGLVPHGIFEACGYFIAAIAGGIIGVLLTKRHLYKHEFGTITKDAAILVIIAFALVAIGALIEAQIIAAAF